MYTLNKTLLHMIKAAAIFLLGNAVCFCTLFGNAYSLILLVPFFIWIHIMPSLENNKYETSKLKQCAQGCEMLRLFLLSTAASIVFVLAGLIDGMVWGNVTKHPVMWTFDIILVVIVESLVFWNGIIRVYVTASQLGVKWRVIGVLCGWIPVLHLVVLFKIISIAEKEVKVEQEKIENDKARSITQICNTKYPILLVHGVFFRDWKLVNYWGRIPEALQKNGATLFYGNHQSALSVEDSGEELAARIKEICSQNGFEKVNVIAHSKGGLDTRYAIAKCKMGDYIASLTTINTPHRGCEFADYLLSKIPKKQQDFVAKTYNKTLKKLGDENPDFLSAVYDLTKDRCTRLNEEIKDDPRVYYQSVGSKLNKASSGRFPLNYSYHLVKHFDGPNDGLVGEASFPWGDQYAFLSIPGKRGISHGDMIDLNRENIDGFDIREYYVQLVRSLKERGF